MTARLYLLKCLFCDWEEQGFIKGHNPKEKIKCFDCGKKYIKNLNKICKLRI